MCVTMPQEPNCPGDMNRQIHGARTGQPGAGSSRDDRDRMGAGDAERGLHVGRADGAHEREGQARAHRRGPIMPVPLDDVWIRHQRANGEGFVERPQRVSGHQGGRLRTLADS